MDRKEDGCHIDIALCSLVKTDRHFIIRVMRIDTVNVHGTGRTHSNTVGFLAELALKLKHMEKLGYAGRVSGLP
jgi:hypothetical protein